MQKININLEEFLNAQSKLDIHIFSKKNSDYKTTEKSRKLALLVELHELINETKIFKFWSSAKPNQEKILTEYIDIFHFTLSIFLEYQLHHDKNQVNSFVFIEDEKKNNDFLINYFLEISSEAQNLLKKENFINWVYKFLEIGSFLGFKFSDIKDTYFKKLDINYQRQKDNY